MTEFEKVLDECLSDIEQGASTLDQCLIRHPEHAQRLKPILLAHITLERGRELRPSSAFKARIRAKLTEQMQAYPRKSLRAKLPLMRPAASIAVIILALLLTGTAYAQSALPGESFYAWKLASENVWRVMSPDPVGTDIVIAERRVNELIAVGDDSALYSQVLKMYLEVVARLKSEMDADNAARILMALDSQAQELNQADVLIQQLDGSIQTPLLTPELPEILPTELPQIIPTLQTPTLPIPTIQIPSILP